MRRQHSNKTISFLMELIFVLLFFTAASAISVFVIVTAREKNEHAIALRNAMVYGENLINATDEKETAYLNLDHFYMDEAGTPSKKKGYYEIVVTRTEILGLENEKECNMKILLDGKKLVELSFLQKGASE